MIVVVFL
jgi:hypothetical protein